MLMYPNVYIADIGASVDFTGYIQGLSKNIKLVKIDSTPLPDGPKTATEIIADLRGTVCDNKGNKLKVIML